MISSTRSELVRTLGKLDDEEAIVLQHLWSFWARDDQLPPQGNDWVTWLILAGRGFGKTRTGAEWVKSLVESEKYSRIALVAEDAGDARDVMVEGESGILGTASPWFKPTYEPSKRRLTWPNGARATLFSADDPESLRGPQFDAAWLDELAKWRYARDAWDMLQFGLRLGKKPRQCVTTTPRPIPLLKEIINRSTTVITRGSTYDNLDNLAPNFATAIVDRYEGTRLGRQELYAHILDDNPNALWHHAIIDQHRVSHLPEEGLARIVVAVDPPATGKPDSDECGIITAGKDGRNHFYVMGDATVQGRSPDGWGQQVIKQYYTFNADAIVAEVNQGGDMVKSVIKHIDPDVPVIEVRATRGKYTRAEPIAGLYEQGKVHHVGTLATLEDQMCDFDVSGLSDGKSPDRMDALVWAITELAGKNLVEPRMRVL